MRVELFPFQRQAVTELRMKTAEALNSYRRTRTPQVVSLQAPTGSGKTIIMAALVEDILFGSDRYAEQPEAIFVWLSDSPALNEQSRKKFELKADRIRLNQCVTIEDSIFDMEELEDGHIYFLNTQKLGKAGNLGKHSDTRMHTIWETLENTAQQKADRLYFIIDEAHRGMQGTEAGRATTIMQRFLKGSKAHNLSAMPVVIGISATAARFNKLVGDTTSTLYRCIIQASDVRASGLLKDRIIITYPENPEKNNEMVLLQAATDEWKAKREHWYQYSYEQHYAQVNPIFLIQVLAGSGKSVSDTSLEDVLAQVEERMGRRFSEHEVVHTFGSFSTLNINGLPVHRVEPPDISDDKRIQLVFFKENLSTGWDCPRAETMMSFRRAEDATYIAQLLGRMVRTPLQSHILVDDFLNDVRLFLPYFNKATVTNVVNELQNTEGGELPTYIDDESLENPAYMRWSVHPRRPAVAQPLAGQVPMDMPSTAGTGADSDVPNHPVHPQVGLTPQQPARPTEAASPSGEKQAPAAGKQLVFMAQPLDRESVIRFINTHGLLTYFVRSVKVSSYLKSLLSLASLLTQTGLRPSANDDLKQEVVQMIREHVQGVRADGKYEALAAQVLTLKLSVSIFDAFGEVIDGGLGDSYFASAESDLDRQLRAADTKLGGFGFPHEYGRKYADPEAPNAFKIDCILFAADDESIGRLNKHAKRKFHELNDEYRKYIIHESDKWKKAYSDIVADGDKVSKHNLALPETISEKVEQDGKAYQNHLYADDDGLAKMKLNTWEEGVLEEEFQRPDFVCWLRNQSRASWAMCIPYEFGGEMKPTYPDFLIIRKDPVLEFVVDLLEPHSPANTDNLAKAKGFARYADAEPSIGRVQMIREGKDAAGKKRFRRLDLSKGSIREKVLHAINNEELDHIFDTDGFFS